MKTLFTLHSSSRLFGTVFLTSSVAHFERVERRESLHHCEA
jgi:hypothetical protein